MARARPSRRSGLAWIVLLVLAGCGGGDDDGAAAPPGDEPAEEPPPQSAYPRRDPDAAAAYAQSAEFIAADPSDAREAVLRARFGRPDLCAGTADPGCAGTAAYRLQNIHVAHTARPAGGGTLTGVGERIAVVDDGFRTSHRELAGKEIRRFLGDASALGTAAHGTAVATVAAGKADGVGMMGVAPDAALHLASWRNTGSASALGHLAAATRDAARHGAVVQNNSWGWRDEKPARREATDFAAAGQSDYAAHMAARKGGTAREWRTLFAAYDDFQETGVVVVANSNDPELGDASAWAALPEFVPCLSEAWIAVGNALFAVDDSTGAILDATMMSAPCGSAAPYCLTVDGSLKAPGGSGDAAYRTNTGTSFAAPQVAGEIALLAQAFPDLGPGELATRLLATARRDWPGFEKTVAGERDFGGLARAYSRVYGHGVPDMKAALAPVGGLAIASGRSVFSGPRAPLDEGIALTAPVVGNALAKALEGRSLMAVDRLGAGFAVAVADLVRTNGAAGTAGRAAGPRALVPKAQALAAAFTAAEGLLSPAPGQRDAAALRPYFAQTLAGAVPRVSTPLPLGHGEYFYAAGTFDSARKGGIADFALSRMARHGTVASTFTLAAGQRLGGLFGEPAPGPFTAARGSTRFAAGLGLSVPVENGWSIAGYGELGTGLVQAGAGALVDYGPVAYASGGVMARRRGLLAPLDRASLYAGVLPTAVAGSARLRLPVGRDRRGIIAYDTVDVDLTASDVPLRFGLSYAGDTANGFTVGFNANADMMAGTPFRPAFDVDLRLRKRF